MDIKKMRGLLLACVAFVSLTLVACEKKGPAESAGEAVDDAAEQMSDKVEDAVEKAGDAMEEAGDKVEEKTDH